MRTRLMLIVGLLLMVAACSPNTTTPGDGVGLPTGDAPVGELTGLTHMLGGLKASADRLQKKTIVTIKADPYSPHYRSIDVLNACAKARLKFVSFSQM